MFCCALFRITYDVTLAIATATRKIEAVAAGGCSISAGIPLGEDIRSGVSRAARDPARTREILG